LLVGRQEEGWRGKLEGEGQLVVWGTKLKKGMQASQSKRGRREIDYGKFPRP